MPSGPEPTRFAHQLHLYDRAQRGDIAPLESFVAAIELLGASTVVGEIGNNELRQAMIRRCRGCYTYCLPKALLNARRWLRASPKRSNSRPTGALRGHCPTTTIPATSPVSGHNGEEVEAASRA